MGFTVLIRDKGASGSRCEDHAICSNSNSSSMSAGITLTNRRKVGLHRHE
uniref:Uncharacterized protein n=1 Tax=Hyaloperonospora arabidopsidis (strain Emoy2) TaxID=559515 RepID=M4BPG5_HYAAE